MSTVVVIRPGCTDYDDQHRIQGSLDLPLNERGRAEVDSLVQQLAQTRLDVIYAPPSEPALSTASAIGDSLGVPVKENDGLRNLDQGLWEGLTVEEVRRKFPKVYKQWKESPESICPPEGETVDEAMRRIRKMLQKPLKRKAAIAVVASEPLASLVTWVVTGNCPRFTRAFGDRSECRSVEAFSVNSTLPPTHPGTNGSAGKGDGKAEINRTGDDDS